MSVVASVIMAAASLLVIRAGDLTLGAFGVVFFGLGAVVSAREPLRLDRRPDVWLLAIGSSVFVVGSFWLIATGRVIAGAAGVILFGTGGILAFRRLLWGRPAADSALVSPVTPVPMSAAVPAAPRGDWFPADAELVPTDVDTAFLEGLRRRALRWPSAGTDSYAVRDESDERTLIAWVSVRADGHELLVFGVHVDGHEVRGDKLHNQLYELERPATTLAMPTPGGPEDRLELVGAWFEVVLRRPVDRLEWWHNGLPYAVRYQFADSREALCEGYSRGRAPAGRPERLTIAEGNFSLPGWIRTGDLGPPDRTLSVRRNGEVLPAPILPRFSWYECPLAIP
jgi:hypothetical protein